MSDLLDWGRVRTFARFTVGRFFDDRCPSVAGALAYTTLFALVPLITALLGILSEFPVFAQWREQITTFLFENFVPATGAAIQGYFTEFAASASKATAIGILILLFSAISLMLSIEDAFNRIFRVPTSRTHMARFVMYWTVLTLGPLLLATALVISSYVLALPLLAQADESFQMKARLLGLLPFLIQWFALTAGYVLIPNCKVHVRLAAIAAFIASLLFEIAKHAFASYVTSGSSYNQIYGALAVIPVFIVWIYLSWIIVLLGASLTASMSAFDYRPNAPRLAEGEEFRGLVRVLGHFVDAQRVGRGLVADDLRAREAFLDDNLTQRYLADLCRAGLIQRSESGEFVLVRDPASTTLFDLYAATNYRLPLLNAPQGESVLEREATVTSLPLSAAAGDLRKLWNLTIGEIFPAAARSEAASSSAELSSWNSSSPVSKEKA
jgi:membrane protein